MSDETCPAWEDGKHCFTDAQAVRLCAHGMDYVSSPPKRCACGAEVKRKRLEAAAPGQTKGPR